MKLVLAVALLTALAFVGSRVSFIGLLLARIERLSGIRHLLLTGTEFVLVGLLLGSHVGVGVLDAAILTGLAPCFGLGLAWIGLLLAPCVSLLSSRGMLASVYAIRAIVCTSLLLLLMIRADLRNRRAGTVPTEP